MKKYIAFILMSLFIIPASARKRSLDDEKVINEIWARPDMPEFKNYNVAEQYKNAPVVILARYQEFIGHVKVAYMGGQMPLRCTELYRNLIKINDNSAIRQFSTVEYMNNTQNVKQVVGIRIIKENGSIVEINPDDYIKISTDLKNRRQKNNVTKIAVPNLQKGDVLDYFIYEEKEINHTHERHFYLNDNAPIQQYRFHGDFDNNLMTDTWYWLPDSIKAKETLNATKERDHLDFTLKNVAKREKCMQSAPFRENPRFRFIFASWESRSKCKELFPKLEYGLHRKGKEERPLINLAFSDYDIAFVYPKQYKNIYKGASKYISQHPGLSDKQKADDLYNYLALNWLPNGYTFNDQKQFFNYFKWLLDNFKINRSYGIALDRYFGDRKEALIKSDFDRIVRLNDGTIYNTCHNGLPCAIDKSSAFDGTEGIFYNAENKAYRYNSCDDYSKLIHKNIPVTPAEKNKTTIVMEVNIDKDDIHALDVKRTVSATGTVKKNYRKQLGTYWQWDSIMRNHFGITTSFQEDATKSKAFITGVLDEWIVYLNKEAFNQKEAFDNEAKEYFANHVKEVKSYKIDSYGLFEKDPAFKYNTETVVEDMVRTTNNSKIVNIGKLLDDMNLNALKKERKADITFKNTFLDSYQISFKIPSGYEVMNQETFDKNITNKCGSFVSKAKVENGQLIVNVDWQINNNQFPASEWNTILEILSGFKSFTNTSVVLTQK
ncbi:MAG: DUF3857 domain-containing protein [Paludibacteraceae bacterium]|nr:DUF3857 domain-containing protein [Paludibacteraceae bacterium]